MKSVTALALLAASAVAAPTATVQEKRQLDLSTFSLNPAALASILPIPSTLPKIQERQLGGLDPAALASILPIPSTLPSVPASKPEASAWAAKSSEAAGLHGIEKRSSVGGVTENMVTQNSGCQELTFIFARGTTELGNMGGVVGPPVANALYSLTGGKVAVQGVDYPADIAGNFELGAAGGPTMAKYVKQALQQCPNTKVVLGGYSQGSMVVHNAANSLSAGQVTAAVLFGDPFKALNVGKLSSSKVKEFCASGDPVCENGFNVLAHLSYGSDAQTAAQFLVQAAGLS